MYQFKLVLEEEIIKIIQSLKANKSADRVDIYPFVLKIKMVINLLQNLSKSITHIINLQKGFFLNLLKSLVKQNSTKLTITHYITSGHFLFYLPSLKFLIRYDIF